MKTIAEEIQSLTSSVDSLSTFKNELTGKGPMVYKKYQDSIPGMVASLREKGVDEKTHPKFAAAMITYNRWK